MLKSTNEESTEYLLDASGLLCPEPIMLLHKKIRELQQGDILKVIATDPSTERDIAKFCTFLKHDLLSIDKEASQLVFMIKKNQEPDPH